MRQAVIVLMIIPLLLFYALPVGAAEKEDRQWQDESVYYLMVDRFMNGNVDNDRNAKLGDPQAFHGGDLEGIIQQLDHIKELGFTAIELSPIMNNGANGYHGFWIEDFKAVEEHYGTMEDAKRLVEEAHKRDLKVIFDFVIGHTGAGHPWMDQSSKEDWYVGNDQQERLTNRWLADAPQLNTENQEVQEYLMDTARFWIEKTGVDAFRINDSSSVSTEFLKQFSEHVTTVKDNFFILANGQDETRTSYVDAYIDADFTRSARDIFKQPSQSLDELYKFWEQQQSRERSPYEAVHFMDDHQRARFTHLAVEEGHNPITRWKMALTYMFTTPGIPVMYYGTEVPLDDGGDPSNIPMMNFKAGNEQLQKRIEKLNSMRDQFPALTKGDFEELYNKEGLAVFKRTYQDQIILIALNNSEKTKTAKINELKKGQQLRGLLHDGIVREQDGGTYRLGMDRETSDVFVVEPDQGYNWLFIGFVGGVLGLFVVGVTVISLKNRRTEQK